MNFSFIIELVSLIWAMLSGWLGILGGLGLDSAGGIADLLGGLL